MSEMVLHGFYILKESFFEKMNDPYLKNNKDGSRPFYYCVKEALGEKDVYWMVPLSSRVDKYKGIIQKRTDDHKPCDGIYVCKLPSGYESVFLIQDIFPVTYEYVDREYTIGPNHLILPYEKDIEAIEKRSRKVIGIIKQGQKLMPTSPNINAILSVLEE